MAKVFPYPSGWGLRCQFYWLTPTPMLASANPGPAAGLSQIVTFLPAPLHRHSHESGNPETPLTPHPPFPGNAGKQVAAYMQ